MYCKKCGNQVEEIMTSCPNCGENMDAQQSSLAYEQAMLNIINKKPVTRKWWFWLIIIVVVFVFFIAVSGSNDDDSKTTEKTEAEITQEQKTDEITTEDPNYRENCVSIAYKDIARMPDNYEDLNVYFSGQVVQVMDDGSSNNCVYRINVTAGEYGTWEDTVYVTYKLPEGSPRILEDDIVNFYGVCKGVYTYTAVLGNDITIPYVDAKYIDIIG